MLPLCLSQGLGSYLMLQAVWIKPKTVPNSYKMHMLEGKVEGGERKRPHLKHPHNTKYNTTTHLSHGLPFPKTAGEKL